MVNRKYGDAGRKSKISRLVRKDLRARFRCASFIWLRIYHTMWCTISRSVAPKNGNGMLLRSKNSLGSVGVVDPRILVNIGSERKCVFEFRLAVNVANGRFDVCAHFIS